jgi:predicted secreted protein
MRWTSMWAIFTLFWVLSAFLVMPFGVRTHEEMGLDTVPGQVLSAPANFRPRRLLIRATVLAVVLFAIFYENYLHGWITVRDIDVSSWFGGPV